MKLNIYAIFDLASGLYSRPFFTQSDAESMRHFNDIVQDADHPVGKHPEDYSLFRIGVFDDNDAKFADENNQCLVTGLEALSKNRNVNKDNLDLFEAEIPKSRGMTG